MQYPSGLSDDFSHEEELIGGIIPLDSVQCEEIPLREPLRSSFSFIHSPKGSTEVPAKVSVLRVAEISVLEEFILYTSICNFNLL